MSTMTSNNHHPHGGGGNGLSAAATRSASSPAMSLLVKYNTLNSTIDATRQESRHIQSQIEHLQHQIAETQRLRTQTYQPQIQQARMEQQELETQYQHQYPHPYPTTPTTTTLLKHSDSSTTANATQAQQFHQHVQDSIQLQYTDFRKASLEFRISCKRWRLSSRTSTTNTSTTPPTPLAVEAPSHSNRCQEQDSTTPENDPTTNTPHDKDELLETFLEINRVIAPSTQDSEGCHPKSTPNHPLTNPTINDKHPNSKKSTTTTEEEEEKMGLWLSKPQHNYYGGYDYDSQVLLLSTAQQEYVRTQELWKDHQQRWKKKLDQSPKRQLQISLQQDQKKRLQTSIENLQQELATIMRQTTKHQVQFQQQQKKKKQQQQAGQSSNGSFRSSSNTRTNGSNTTTTMVTKTSSSLSTTTTSTTSKRNGNRNTGGGVVNPYQKQRHTQNHQGVAIHNHHQKSGTYTATPLPKHNPYATTTGSLPSTKSTTHSSSMTRTITSKQSSYPHNNNNNSNNNNNRNNNNRNNYNRNNYNHTLQQEEQQKQRNDPPLRSEERPNDHQHPHRVGRIRVDRQFSTALQITTGNTNNETLPINNDDNISYPNDNLYDTDEKHDNFTLPLHNSNNSHSSSSTDSSSDDEDGSSSFYLASKDGKDNENPKKQPASIKTNYNSDSDSCSSPLPQSTTTTTKSKIQYKRFDYDDDNGDDDDDELLSYVAFSSKKT